MKALFLPLAFAVSLSVPAVAQVATNGIANAKIQRIQELAKSVENHGLLYSLYFTPAVTVQLESYATVNNQADLDSKLSSIVNQIASDLSRGRVLPTQIANKVTIKAKAFAHKATADGYLRSNLSPSEFINTVAPKNSIYRSAQQAVEQLVNRKAEGNWTEKPANLSLDVVSSKTTNRGLIEFLRKKLSDYGYANNTSNLTYDSELNQAIRQFQTDNNLGVDGVVGNQSWKLLGKNLSQIITQAILNLDRTRWLPDQIPAEHIYVNLARQEFKMLRNNEEILSFKTINGRFDRQTPIMVDVAKSVVLNPTWTVPRNIFVKDKLALIKQDPGYVARSNMKLMSDVTGKEVDPYTVDWNQDPKKLAYTLVQQPGSWNALGFIKFPLTNGYAIYLHDTNERSLFGDANRLRSSGCVRLERPFELAEKLLDNPRYTVDALKGLTELNPVPATKQTFLTPARAVPVYLFYQTLNMKDGKLLASNDPYEVDLDMYQALIASVK